MRLKYIHKILILVTGIIMTLILGGCSSDETVIPDTPGTQPGTATLRLAVAQMTDGNNANGEAGSKALTRQSVSQSDIPDTQAKEGEMMKSWVVVAVNNNNATKVAKLYHYEIPSGEREIDHVAIDDLKGLTYTFYAFANLTDDQLMEIGLKTKSDDTYSWIADGSDLPDFTTKALLIQSNQGSANGTITGKGDIPMSSKATTYTIASDGSHDYDIQLVRMVSKIRLEITNPDNHDVRITEIEIDSLTSNNQGNDSEGKAIANLKLLPADKDNVSNRRPTNLAVNRTDDQKSYTVLPTTQNVIVTIPDDAPAIQAKAGVDGNAKWTYDFYVNESALDELENSHTEGFKISLTGNSNTGTYTPKRLYSFEDFKRIARNEIHVIPIKLDRFIEFEPKAFTAIGVVPVISDRDDYALITTGMYGAYHIIPTVKDWAGNTYTITSVTTTSNNRIPEGTKDGDFTVDLASHKPEVRWNAYASTPTIELYVGNYSGTATYEFTATVKDAKGNIYENITRRFRIQNTAINFNDPDWSKRWKGGLK